MVRVDPLNKVSKSRLLLSIRFNSGKSRALGWALDDRKQFWDSTASPAGLHRVCGNRLLRCRGHRVVSCSEDCHVSPRVLKKNCNFFFFRVALEGKNNSHI